MWNPFKKTPAQPQAPQTVQAHRRVVLTVWLEPDGGVTSNLSWPVPVSDEDADMTVLRTSVLLHKLNSGQLYPLLQQAIGEAGVRDHLQAMGQRILNNLNNARDSKVRETAFTDETPVIDPEEVFGMETAFQ